MKYILDSCVALKWFLPETHSDIAIKLRDEFLAHVHELISPDVFPIELTHALTRAERQGRITADQGGRLFENALTMLPDIVPSLPLLPRAREISSQARIGVYDCLYVALAEREQCDLVTADERLLKNLPGYPIVALKSL